jgi:hypothetical protein
VSKPFWQSKTFWANVILVLLSILDNAYFGAMVPSEAKAIIIGAFNLALRFLTTGAVTLTKEG